MRRLSEATGLHVVLGCGWYRATVLPGRSADRPHVDRRVGGAACDEIEHGVAGTDVRPGVIGEIGSHKDFVSAQEERVFRAAGRAATRSGLAVTTHSVASRVGLEHLALLRAEGVDPSRVVIGHADSFPFIEYHRAVLSQGAYVEFDNLGYRLQGWRRWRAG